MEEAPVEFKKGYLRLMRLISPMYSLLDELKKRKRNKYTRKEFVEGIRKSEQFDKSQLEGIQLEKLKKRVNHAYNTIPFYRKLLDKHNLSPKDIRALEDISKLPIVKKADIRKYGIGKEVVSSSLKRGDSHLVRSSGSTGVPFMALHSMDSWMKQFVYMRCRRMGWAGISFYDRQISMGRRETEDSNLNFRIKPDHISLPHFTFDDEKCRQFMDIFYAFKPSFVRCYSQTLAQIARYALDNGLDAKLKSVLTGGSMLVDKDKKLIEKAFNTEIYESYMAGEIGLIASDCECHRLHVSMERVIVEAVDENGEVSKSGNVLLTSLDNYAMPFIRYEIGDMANLGSGKCSCGRGLQIVDSLQGRATDVIITPSGKAVHLKFFMKVFGRRQDLMNFKVIQEDSNSIKVYINPEKSFSKAKEEILLKELKDTLDGMSIEIQRAKEVFQTHTFNKYKYIENKARVT